MLTRRSLLGTTAVLAAGCSTVGNPLTPPSAPQDAEIKVAAFTRSIYLSMPYGNYVPMVTIMKIDTNGPWQRLRKMRITRTARSAADTRWHCGL